MSAPTPPVQAVTLPGLPKLYLGMPTVKITNHDGSVPEPDAPAQREE